MQVDDRLAVCSSDTTPYSSPSSPRRKIPPLQAVMKLDLSSYANYASPPAQATQAPDKGPLYSLPISLLLAALAHMGLSVWQ